MAPFDRDHDRRKHQRILQDLKIALMISKSMKVKEQESQDYNILTNVLSALGRQAPEDYKPRKWQGQGSDPKENHHQSFIKPMVSK